MGKVTSKLQVTIPKAIAERFGIAPGAEVDWEPAGDAIRMVPTGRRRAGDPRTRLKLFDQVTERQRQRQRERPLGRATERGWTRDELYSRGSPR